MVIDLGNRASWEKMIAQIVQRHVPVEVIEAVRKIPAARMYDDTMKYFEESLQAKGASPLFLLLPKMQGAMSRSFSALRAYHACKPTSLASYHQHGLVPLTRQWLANEAFELFEGTIPRGEISRRVTEADLSIRKGHVWFATNPDELTDMSAGHYLIYGPECMNCLWHDDARLFDESQSRQRRRGIPTLFECAVPLAQIDREDKRALTKLLVTQYLKSLSDTPETEEWAIEFGFSLRRSLRPEHILGHTHPAAIPDQKDYGRDYHNPITTCPFCVQNAAIS
ncbi:MAG: hypothetical protein WC205_07985 [Opitutaceae bacterium]|jgi:hypothetical protein